jgi:hypothetical protein
MRATLHEFADLPPEERTLERLFAILRSKYDSTTPDDHVRLVYDRLVALLQGVFSDSGSLPHLLIDIASSIFLKPAHTGTESQLEIGGIESLERESLETGEAEAQTEMAERASQEVETEATESADQQTQAGVDSADQQTQAGMDSADQQTQAVALQDDATSQTGPYAMDFSETVLLFERAAVNMVVEETNEPLEPIDCDITVKHWPFRRFTSFKRMPPTMRGTAVVPNIKTIITIIRFNAMPAPQLDLQKNRLIARLKQYADDRLIILMSCIGLKMKGIYILQGSDEVTAGKIWGAGPQRVTEGDVGTYWKYLTGSKHFDPIPAKHFTQTTDCVCLKRVLEPRDW